jgi:hypothetical protein
MDVTIYKPSIHEMWFDLFSKWYIFRFSAMLPTSVHSWCSAARHTPNGMWAQALLPENRAVLTFTQY